MSFESLRPTPARHAHPARLLFVFSGVLVLLSVVVFRLSQLALVDGDKLHELAASQHGKTISELALRGEIVDRSGERLAMTVDSADIFLRPRKVPTDADPRGLLVALGLDEDTWRGKVSSRSPFVYVKRSPSESELEAARAAAFPGVEFEATHRRVYPHEGLAGAVLGFANVDGRGLEGLERRYDEYLRGAGTSVGLRRDAHGRSIYSLHSDTEQPRGATVELTLDLPTQYAAERELEGAVRETGAASGTAIVLSVRTGEVLALAQSPAADPNRPGRVAVGAWRNRSVSDVFEPGSTAKALVAAAALEEGVVRPDERIHCEHGRWYVGRKPIHDHHGHGVLTFADVLKVSSNIGIAKVGERLGRDRLEGYLRAFGLGAKTGVDLPGESAGMLRAASEWYPLDLAAISFGQGVAVTAMQLASAYATLANDGDRMRPYVVRSITAAQGEVLYERNPELAQARVVSPATARTVAGLLRRVVEEGGTGTEAAVPGVRVAGKTGTSQKADLVAGGYSDARIASFAGFFPVDDPELAIVVMIDEPQTAVYGGVVAAPVFREIAKVAVERFELRRDDPPEVELLQVATSPALPASEGFLGLSLREALAMADSIGLRVEIEGSGYVAREVALDEGFVRLELEAPDDSLRAGIEG